MDRERDSHTQIRFAETPPDSPKSCMKGSRRINFADTAEVSSSSGGGDGGGGGVASSSSASTSSPKRSTKTVVIKSPGMSTVESSSHEAAASSSSTSSSSTTTNAATSTVTKPPGEIQFQFHLSQHYEQSTPPPNCTSGNHDHPSSSSSSASSSSNNNYQNSGDPELVEIASKFVNEIIERAKMEASARQKPTSSESESYQQQTGPTFRGDFFTGRQWYRRAHGAISKWITNLCVRAQNSMRT